MSLILAGSNPQVTLKTINNRNVFMFTENEDIEIPIDAFLDGVMYVLQNTDLRANDPRIEFIEMVKACSIVPGHASTMARMMNAQGWDPIVDDNGLRLSTVPLQEPEPEENERVVDLE